MKEVRPELKEDEIDFELFVRVVALLLELRNLNSVENEHEEEDDEEDVEEEKKWHNQEE